MKNEILFFTGRKVKKIINTVEDTVPDGTYSYVHELYL